MLRQKTETKGLISALQICVPQAPTLDLRQHWLVARIHVGYSTISLRGRWAILMLLRRLPRPQSVWPVWTVRSTIGVEQRAAKSTGKPARRRNESSNISLFEELFPEEAKASREGKGARKTNGGRLELKDDHLREFRQVDGKRPSPSSGREPEQRDQRDVQAAKGEFEASRRRAASVLVLSTASKSLSLSDFLRLSPKGQHIDGWASGIIKVIPGRDQETLEPQGHYFILFGTDSMARAYQDRVLRLHRISKTYTPSSITSGLSPPPGWHLEGEDVHDLMQAFTLVPAAHPKVHMRLLKKPLRPVIQRMIAEGGHRSLARRQAKSEDMVLFSLDKGQLPVYELRAILGRDGRERNLQWDIRSGDDGIVNLRGEKEDAGKDARKTSGRLSSRFIISFNDQQEARRFVRAWHKRPLPTADERRTRDEIPPIVNAQILW
jgi:hypothetical protein